MRTLNLDEAAALLKVSPRSLSDKRYRTRLGLAGRKVGRRLIFIADDVHHILERGREHFPGEGRRRTKVSRTRCCTGIDVRLSAKLTLDFSTLCFLLRLIGSALRLSYCNERVRACLLCSGYSPNG